MENVGSQEIVCGRMMMMRMILNVPLYNFYVNLNTYMYELEHRSIGGIYRIGKLVKIYISVCPTKWPTSFGCVFLYKYLFYTYIIYMFES